MGVLTKFGLFLFGIMPFVESMNGVFLTIPISDGYRLILLLYVLYYLLFYKGVIYSQTIEMLLVISFFLLFLVLQFTVIHQMRFPFTKDLKSLFRVMLCIIYYAYFYKALKESEISKSTLDKMLFIYAISYSIAIIIPFLLGRGVSTYNHTTSNTTVEGIGFKAFFIEVNSLTALLIGCLVYMGERLLKELRLISQKKNQTSIKNDRTKEIIITIVGFVLNIASLFLVSTKTGVFSAIIYSLLFLFRLLFSKLIRFKVKIIILLSSIAIVIPWGTKLINEVSTSLVGLIQRSVYFYNQMGGNLIQVITSNRSTFLQLTIDQFLDAKKFLFIHIIGAGYYVNMENPMIRRMVTEMDLADFYFTFGILGMIIYVSYFRKSLKNIFLLHSDRVNWMLIALLTYGFFAGHVLFNAMTGTFLSILFAYHIDDEKLSIESRN